MKRWIRFCVLQILLQQAVEYHLTQKPHSAIPQYSTKQHNTADWVTSVSISCCNWLHSRTQQHLSPVYTIQPVVKPFWQPVVSCIQTFDRLSNPFDNRFDKRLYRVYSRLSNRLYNTVWQPVERTAVRSTWLSNRFGCIVTDQDKSAFYERLEQVYLQVPRRDTVIIEGDMNAKIGEGSPIRRHALGTMNDTGARLVNFARANAFVAANCLVRRHPRRLYTWKSFDLTCRNQTDYFLVKERWKSSICKCKAIQGAECDSDNSLLGMKFKLKLRRLQNPRVSTRYDYSNVEEFHIELRNRFTTLARSETADPDDSVQSPSECSHSGIQMTWGERTMNSQGRDANAKQQWENLRDTILQTARRRRRRRIYLSSLTKITITTKQIHWQVAREGIHPSMLAAYDK